MKKHLRDAVAALEDIGCTDIQVDLDRRHPRIHFTWFGRRASITAAGTPRSASDQINYSIQQARRALGIHGEPGERRKRERKRRIKPESTPVPKLSPDPRPDFRDDLARHPHYPAVLELRTQEAFANLWRDVCLQLFGKPSVKDTVIF